MVTIAFWEGATSNNIYDEQYQSSREILGIPIPILLPCSNLLFRIQNGMGPAERNGGPIIGGPVSKNSLNQIFSLIFWMTRKKILPKKRATRPYFFRYRLRLVKLCAFAKCTENAKLEVITCCTLPETKSLTHLKIDG